LATSKEKYKDYTSTFQGSANENPEKLLGPDVWRVKD